MRPPFAPAALAVALFPPAARGAPPARGADSVLCPAASGDGRTDDLGALQECLGNEAHANRAIELKRGAKYLISDTLLLVNRRQIFGGANAQGVLTSIRCSGKDSAFNATGELQLYGIHLDGCGIATTDDLTLVDSIVSGCGYGVRVAGAERILEPQESVRAPKVSKVLVRRSSIVDSYYNAVLMTGRCHLVMTDSSEIARTGLSAVVLRDSGPSVLELHSSAIRDSTESAIANLAPAVQTEVLLTDRSSLQSSGGPCILLRDGSFHMVTIEGGSWIQNCDSGIEVQDGFGHSVVVQGHSTIFGCQRGVYVERGVRTTLTVKDESSIHSSFANAIRIGRGSYHKVFISEHSRIEDTAGSAIRIDGGSGHLLHISNGSWVKNSSKHGIVLVAFNSTLTLEGTAIRESRGDAVRVEPALRWGFQELAISCSCTLVSLQDVYLVRNQQGFRCFHTCVEGKVDGTIYLNNLDFRNECGGSLSLQNPLSKFTEFHTLRAAVLWCTCGMAVGFAALPWLHMLHMLTLAHVPWLLTVGVGALLVLVSGAWAQRMLSLLYVMQHLMREDITQERVTFVFTLCTFVAVFVPSASLIAQRWWFKHWREGEVSKLLRALEESLWHRDAEREQFTRARLVVHGLSPAWVKHEVEELRKQQSQEAGVSVAYLLSSDFLDLARARTGLENPTFLQMKDTFWSGKDALGKEVLCPRDGCPGCALVDTLHPRHRQRCTHFLSWVWRYPILLVREALHIWTEGEGLDPSETFLFMCFFVNNQFRILIEGTQAGSDDLETTFEQNLRRIGRLVAILDHWEEPLYLSRIWTIYEQYMAAKLRLPVTIILDRKAGESLIAELDRGKEGILRITGTLCNVRAELAEASVKADEEHVKARIRSTMGFHFVNQRVRHSMIDWVSSVLRRHMDSLVDNIGASPATRAEQVRRVSCTQLTGALSPAVLDVEVSG